MNDFFPTELDGHSEPRRPGDNSCSQMKAMSSSSLDRGTVEESADIETATILFDSLGAENSGHNPSHDRRPKASCPRIAAPHVSARSGAIVCLPPRVANILVQPRASRY